MRRRTTANPPWYWRIDFKSRAVWTGYATPEQVASRLVALYASGEHLQDRPKGGQGGGQTLQTVADLLGAWVAHKQADPDSKASSLRTWTIRARNVSRTVGDVPLTQLRDHPEQVQAEHKRKRRAVMARTQNNELMALTAAWKWAVTRKILRKPDGGSLPTMPAAYAKETEPERYTPPLADLYAVLPHLEGWPRTCLLLSMATGCRIGELGNLRWRDVHLDSSRPHLTLAKTKTDGTRTVPLGPGIVEVLEAWRDERNVGDDSRVLGPRPRQVCNVGTYWDRGAAKARVRPFRNHGVRRLVVARMLNQGVDPKTVASITGHSVTVMLRDYVKPTDESRYDAILRTGLGSPLPVTGKVIEL